MTTLFFLISGFASLVYQVVTMKMFSLVLGHSTLASTLTVSAYMAGLALGSIWLGKRSGTLERPLRTYGMLEIGVAVSGFLVPAVTGMLAGTGAAHWLPTGPTSFVVARALLALVAFLIPTTLMGGTLPILLEYEIRRGAGTDAAVSRLYAVNALGAAAGALLTGFVLIPATGLMMTMKTSLALYLLVGVAALVHDRRMAEQADSTPTEAVLAEVDAQQAQIPLGLAMMILGITGGLLMGLEHVWFRFFILIFDSSTYSFSLILAMVILGISCGSLLASFRRRTTGATLDGVTITLALYAGLLLLSVPLYDDLPYYFFRFRTFVKVDWYQYCALRLLAGTALILPAAACSGYLFPTVLSLAAGVGEGRTERVGLVSAVNTAGTIVGSGLATFFVVPWIGLQATIEASAVCLGLLLLALVAKTSVGRGSRACAAAWLLLLVLYGANRVPWKWNYLGSAVYRVAGLVGAETFDKEWSGDNMQRVETLFREHGVLATVSVDKESESIGLRINGKAEGSTSSDMDTQRLIAHLPLVLHPEPKDVMLIGLGTGVTAAAALRHEPGQLTVCELSPGVLRASEFFKEVNNNFLENPRTRMLVEDARTVLIRESKTYDVIISEPTNPWVAGISSLFTTEFFELVRSRLEPDGVYIQWFHAYEMDGFVMSIILRSFERVFPEASLWSLGLGDFALIVGRDKAPKIDLAMVEAAMRRGSVRADLEDIGLASPTAVAALELLDAPMLRKWGLSNAPVNTDDDQTLEYEAPLAFFKREFVRFEAVSPDTLYSRELEDKASPEELLQVARFFARTRPELRAEQAYRKYLAKRPEDRDARKAFGAVLGEGGRLVESFAELVAVADSPELDAASCLALGRMGKIVVEQERTSMVRYGKLSGERLLQRIRREQVPHYSWQLRHQMARVALLEGQLGMAVAILSAPKRGEPSGLLQGFTDTEKFGWRQREQEAKASVEKQSNTLRGYSQDTWLDGARLYASGHEALGLDDMVRAVRAQPEQKAWREVLARHLGRDPAAYLDPWRPFHGIH